MTTTPTDRRAGLTDRVAEEIRAMMGRRRLTGAQLARLLGVSQMWVSYRLNGRQPIDLNDLERIAHVLGVDPADLLPARRREPLTAGPSPFKVPGTVRPTSGNDRPMGNRPITERPKSGPGRGGEPFDIVRTRRLKHPQSVPSDLVAV